MYVCGKKYLTLSLAWILAIFSAPYAFAEVQTELNLTMPSLTNPGANGSFSASSTTGPAATGSGQVTKTYGGVLEYVLSSGSGRFSSVTGATRYGLGFDSFQVLQSFLTANHFTAMSANTTCPTVASGTHNWILVRARPSDASRGPMDMTSNSLAIGGTLAHDHTSTPQFTASGHINLNQTNFGAASYNFTGYSGATCNNASLLVAGSDSTLDPYGTFLFGSNSMLYISQSGNPLIALAVPQVVLTTGKMLALSGSAFTGLYTSFDSTASQTRKNVVLVPDSNGTIFSIEEISNLASPLTRTTVGTLTCTTLNSPANGYCSGTLVLNGTGGTGKVICQYGETPDAMLACMAQKPGQNSTAVSIVATVLPTSTLAVTFSPSIAEAATLTVPTNITSTLSNLSGRKIPTIGLPSNPALRLSAPFELDASAFTGSSNTGGLCGTSLDAYGTCTVTITFTPDDAGSYSQLYRVAYDDGTGTVNATSNAVGVAQATSLSISPSTGFTTGSNQQLTVTAHYSDGSSQDVTAIVQWSVDNAAIGSVNTSGLFTPTLTGGAIEITASLGAVSTQITPTVFLPWGGTQTFGAVGPSPTPSFATINGNGIARDSLDNVYVAGSTSKGLETNALLGNSDAYLAKYDSAGALQWIKQLGAPGAGVNATAVTVDSSDFIYITGTVSGAGVDGASLTGTLDLFVTKYNASGTIQWTRMLGVSTKQTSSNAIVADSSNNVYVTGYTMGALDGQSFTGLSALFITKYNSSGTKQWTRLSGVASKSTIAYAITRDGSDNVYIAGATNGALDSQTLTGVTDMFLSKYNSSGTRQWTRLFGVSTKVATAYGITADASDNMYIVGTSSGALGGVALTGTQDMFLTKYNSSGTRALTRMLGATSKASTARGVALDSSNNIYITGNTNGAFDGNTYSGTSNQIGFIAKFDNTATKSWTRVMQNATATTLFPNAITVDTSGNPFITGNTQGAFSGNSRWSNTDYFLVKYDGSGNLSSSLQQGEKKRETYAKSMAVDSSGNIFVAGHTYGNLQGNTIVGYTDPYIAKYNSAGTRLWITQRGVAAGTVQAEEMVLDSAGNIYLGGLTTVGLDGNTQTGSQDLFLMKFNSSGVWQWTRQLGVASAQSSAYGISIDSLDGIYLAGSTGGDLDGVTKTGMIDMFLVKYDTAGTKQWTRLLGATGSTVNVGYKVTVDSSNGVYVYGYSNGNFDGVTLIGTSEPFVTKYDTSGTKQWTRRFGAPGESVESAGISSDASDNIYVSAYSMGGVDGNTISGAGAYDAVLVKYDSSGTKQWTRQMGAGAGNYLFSNSSFTDTAGNTYIAAQVNAALDGQTFTGGTYNAALIKYDTSGTKQWTRLLGAAGVPSASASGIDVRINPLGDVVFLGTVSENFEGQTLTGGLSPFLVQYTAAGVKK